MIRLLPALFFLALIDLGTLPAHAAITEYPKVRLRSLDKITARTMTFDAHVGTTIKFGSIYIKILACKKPDLQERPEAASFLQIWEITPDDVSKWVFSGWMMASSPALSAMDHPIYDVWVMDCLADPAKQKPVEAPPPKPTPTINDVVKKATDSPDAEPDTTGDGPVTNAPAPPAPQNTPIQDPVQTDPFD